MPVEADADPAAQQTPHQMFLQQAPTADHARPWCAKRDLRMFWECGILARDFLRLFYPGGKQLDEGSSVALYLM